MSDVKITILEVIYMNNLSITIKRVYKRVAITTPLPA